MINDLQVRDSPKWKFVDDITISEIVSNGIVTVKYNNGAHVFHYILPYYLLESIERVQKRVLSPSSSQMFHMKTDYGHRVYATYLPDVKIFAISYLTRTTNSDDKLHNLLYDTSSAGRLHEQFLCDNFDVTIFICSCRRGKLGNFCVAITVAEKLAR
jgi:hypothetical protein